ncbi:MAG: FAD-dependent oxidoreductase [Eubacteriales bacterium]|nr:FAD-dependent oxidoreductase [Eubacteriales bacterium]
MSDYRKLYDVIIVGGGPAGLSAAIYAARAKERVLVIEKNEFGGQIALTAKVCNYPGVKECSGTELVEYMKEQAQSFGAELIYGDITDMDLDCPVKTIRTRAGEYRALGVILAPGSVPRCAGFEGEKEYKGAGVAYCATCDGQLFGGCDLFVVGGGLAAVEEAIYLTKYAKNITLVVREYDFTCAKTVSDRLQLYPNIKVLFHTEIVKVAGEGIIDSVTLIDHVSGESWEEKAGENPFGVFVFVGYEPNTAWLPDILAKDEAGYLLTDRENKTNIDGVCAAGDVRQKSLRQVVTAASDGAIAAVALEPLIEKMHTTRNIPCLVEEKNTLSEVSSLTEKAIVRLWTDDSPLSKEMEAFFEEEDQLHD